MEKSETPIHGQWERKLVQPLWKTVAAVPQTELAYDPVITLLGICPREMKIYVHTDIYK